MADRQLEELVRRLQVIEDEQAIQRLVNEYAWLCDDAYNPDGLAALFTEDAKWSSASPDGQVDFGHFQGREAIREYFAGASATIGPMTLHYVMAPHIILHADGKTASGRWFSLTYMQRQVAGSTESETVVLGSTYDDDYVKVDGRWLFARRDCTISFDAPVFPS
ncbi:MAG TPA: nuclear transport factor 2 family protein [Anaerolineae bacterium]|nr:nuclear transport factor 2 family protein [Anaerolineae bacterium]HPL27722.1 nuclear transport factor 2 family protein [Anaerolineae bacterium]